ncbi:MAG: hypothetical protein BAJATHORv1_20282 [Candidatus Thorarchaeota archaeon]|nr:MAG: hypothetical protein BAJATHORv1_20282 [Candidatus Thorarchaeota archaeon]
MSDFTKRVCNSWRDLGQSWTIPRRSCDIFSITKWYELKRCTSHNLVMMVARAYRYELDPNNHQRTLLYKSAGTARFAYNWGLARRIEEYKSSGQALNAIELHRELNARKQTEFPWMYEVSKCAPQESLRDLDRAFTRFFERVKTGKRPYGFPRFKKRGGRDSFRLTGTIRVIRRSRVRASIQLPRLGRIRIKEKRRDSFYRGRILSATVTRRADKWFVSITVEEELADPDEKSHLPEVGVDLGLTVLATLSDGIRVENPRPLRRYLRRFRRLSKALSRKKRGSKNYEKAKMRLARLHLRIHYIRQDTLHKLTTRLAKNHSVVVIEDLGVSGMLKNRRLSRAIADVGWYEFRRQLEYKCSWYGTQLVIAPRTYPSSKRCSRCGHSKVTLELSDRTYRCEACGLVLDRDHNAARNLLQLIDDLAAVSCTEAQNACGERVRHHPSSARSDAFSRKQETDNR